MNCRNPDEVLRESEQRFRALLENSIDAAYRRDLRTDTYDYVSPVIERLTGYRPEELWSMSADDVLALIHPDDLAEVRAWLARLTLADGEVLEYRLRCKDGTYRWFADSAVLQPGPDGRPAFLAGNLKDTTEWKRAERALRESEERLAIAREAAGLGIHDYDVRTGAIRWDRRIRDWWGVAPQDPVTFETFVEGIHPDDREAAVAGIDAALDPAGTGLCYVEYRVRNRQDGVERWIAATGQAFFDSGRAVRLVGTAQDITARKQGEEALERANAVLAEADRRKDEFLAVLGHELRNPLAPLRMRRISCTCRRSLARSSIRWRR